MAKAYLSMVLEVKKSDLATGTSTSEISFYICNQDFILPPNHIHFLAHTFHQITGKHTEKLEIFKKVLFVF